MHYVHSANCLQILMYHFPAWKTGHHLTEQQLQIRNILFALSTTHLEICEVA